MPSEPMTRDEILKLDGDALNRAVAEAAGWRISDYSPDGTPWGWHKDWSPEMNVSRIPNYAGSVDACLRDLAPEWGAVSHTDRMKWLDALDRAFDGDYRCGWIQWEVAPHALKARKLAEAFLLWKAGAK